MGMRLSVSMIVIRRVAVLLVLILMRVVAVHGMSGHEAVHNAREDLDTQNAAEEAGNKDPRSFLGSEATGDQSSFGGRQHVV